LDYVMEVKISGHWYQVLLYKYELAGPSLFLNSGDSFLYAISKNNYEKLYPGKYRIVLGNIYSIIHYYCEFNIVELGSDLPRKPKKYDRNFLQSYPSLSRTVEPEKIVKNSPDAVKLEIQPVATDDNYLCYETGIDVKIVKSWLDLNLETKINGKWCTIASYLYIRDKYVIGYPLFEDVNYIDITFRKVFLPRIWEPTGPFPGTHRLWGTLVLEDGTKVIAYGEFEIIDAAKAAHAGTSAWAQETVRSAISAGLVPQNLQEKYQQPITRAEFTALSLAYLESETGLSTLELLQQKNLTIKEGVFNDTDDTQVLAAHALGIVEGMDKGVFNPTGNITREQLATMLTRTLSVLNGNITSTTTSAYTDRNQFSSWAVSSINYVTEHKIMNGMGDNRFDPKGNCTREQAIVTFYRMITNK